METTRFAPSPNGALHLGHAYSAIVAHDLAQASQGRFLLRVEDIDGSRSRPALAAEFREDLAWLGLTWEDVPAQSLRTARYTQAAQKLQELGLMYPCSCTRAQIAATATQSGPDGLIYPGTCRKHQADTGQPVAWRLDTAKAMALTGPLVWIDERAGPQEARPQILGDPVLVRKDPETPASYHLAATVDDASDGVTLVTRGADLFHASHLHRLLQEILGLPVPRWFHHDLLLDGDGKKLAKRRNSPSLTNRRLAGEDGIALAHALRSGRLPTGIVRSSGVEA